MQEFTLKELQLIQSAFRNWRLLTGGIGDWSKADRLEKKLERKARLLTKRAVDGATGAAQKGVLRKNRSGKRAGVA